MEVKMKVEILCCVLLLAGSASCSPVEADSISVPDIHIPDWILDQITDLELPDAIQNIIDRLPDIIAAIPDIIDRIPEIVEQIINKIPEVIPILIDKLPEIIAQIPALVERICEILKTIINRIPELIPIILEKIPVIIEAIPAIIEKIKVVYDRIREILEGLDLPDWFPTLPELEKPDWWPDGIPEIPEINRPTPGTPTTVSEYPGIVQIEVGTGFIWAQGCVGSVLTSFHILSVASCFSGKGYADRFRRVRAGSSTRYNGGMVIPVANAVVNSDFGNGNGGGDIAVIRLYTNLVLGANIQQTAIVPQGFNTPTGVSVVVVGWGSTAQGKLIADRGLYEIALTNIDSGSCASRWNRVPFININQDNTICVADAQYGGRNGDVRDMGAPVYFQGILTGIVTFGAPVGNQYFPVVCTSVGSYTNWVVENAV